MTPNEKDHVTSIPTVEAERSNGSLDVNSLVNANNDDQFADLFTDTTDGGLPTNANTVPVPTTNKQNPDYLNLGKSLLSGYAEWKEGEFEHDPHEDPVRYLLHDSPELIVAAVVAGYLSYKGIQGLGSLASSASTSDKAKSRTQPRLPLENRAYRLFVSHSWKYSEHFERIQEFLDDDDRLEWHNFSIPEDDPLEFEDRNDLRQKLYQQVRQANVIIVIAGMYVSHSEWIEEEIEMAEHFDKPIIGVRPNGNQRIPASVQEAAVDIVGWRQKSIVNAIAKHG
ncbi:TIR domain-containing protein [Haloferax chudinovii]|uniref:TIR domain-containing protein n=1 Tax=Haloferax chudinovii TaxID=1109010 RepID=A0ABD5XH08_9EURY